MRRLGLSPPPPPQPVTGCNSKPWDGWERPRLGTGGHPLTGLPCHPITQCSQSRGTANTDACASGCPLWLFLHLKQYSLHFHGVAYSIFTQIFPKKWLNTGLLGFLKLWVSVLVPSPGNPLPRDPHDLSSHFRPLPPDVTDTSTPQGVLSWPPCWVVGKDHPACFSQHSAS